VPHPVFVSHVFFHHKPHRHKHHVHSVHRPAHKHVVPHHVIVTPHHRVPEAQRQPIVRSAPLIQQGLHKVMPAANAFSQSGPQSQLRQPEPQRRSFGAPGNGNGLRKPRG
jgi:hypothetical protein